MKRRRRIIRRAAIVSAGYYLLGRYVRYQERHGYAA